MTEVAGWWEMEDMEESTGAGAAEEDMRGTNESCDKTDSVSGDGTALETRMGDPMKRWRTLRI